jgi:hypothetical protein
MERNSPVLARAAWHKGPRRAARQIWVTETALTTALYTSYFAEGGSLFAIIVGVAMLLIGIGFVVFLAYGRRKAPPPQRRRERRRAGPQPEHDRRSHDGQSRYRFRSRMSSRRSSPTPTA